MRKLHIGMVVEQLEQSQKIVEDKQERDLTVRDLIVQLYPGMGGQQEANSAIITDTVLKIRNCKEEWIEMENHDYDVLKAAVQGCKLLVWVQSALTKAFKED